MEDKIILYHRVMRRENFEKATRDLFDLLKTAQVKSPNIDRILYVDIDGHKNSKGGFDHDMFELQQDFGIGFLGKFFSEVHFPLIDFINPNPQCNDIPAGLSIFSPDNQTNNQLHDLYIENYSNTEFISEPDIYEYLQKVHDFLLEYRDFDLDCMIHEDNQNPQNSHLRIWKTHISELINELYNALVFGNLFSVSAMTRTLIECFVFFSILCQSKNDQLIHHWYICNVCCTQKIDNTLQDMIQKYCGANNLDFKTMWNTYSKDPRNKRWLRQVIPNGTLDFRAYCNYLEDPHIYEDYESACSFVHGQDLASKIRPFIFYHSICYRFDMMMLYIFRTIRLFPLTESLDMQLTDLEDELITVSEKYFK